MTIDVRSSARIVPAVLVFALIVSGCGSQEDQTKPVPSVSSATPAPSDRAEATPESADEQDEIAAPFRVRYSCEDGKAILAEYVESHTGEQNANLEIGGKAIGLALTQSASGAKYESDTSLSPGRKLTWWTKGEEAILIEADSDDADGSSETIVKCQQTAT